jgi:hypothetical protein
MDNVVEMVVANKFAAATLTAQSVRAFNINQCATDTGMRLANIHP